MLLVGGLVTALNLALNLAVGLRLLSLARRTRQLPEFCLAVYFVLSAVIATIPQLVVYSSLADPSRQVPEPLARVLLAIAAVSMAVGACAVYVFTWKTFRPDRAFARAIVAAGCSAVALGVAIEAFAEGFAPVVFAGPGHWLAWAGRTAAMLGIAFESLRCWAMARRRLRLGLADPLVTDRFLMLGVWASCACLNYVADLATRGIYVWMAGTRVELVPAVLERIVPVTVLVTMAIGAVSAATLFVAFFPPERYRRRLEARAAART